MDAAAHSFAAPEWVMFVLSNVIIWYFCGGRLSDDVRRWTGRERRADGASNR
jgi:hypothetical protein